MLNYSFNSLSPEFLQSRVEVPMLGIVTGGSMAFMALLILSLIVLCLMQKNKSKTIGETTACLCVQLDGNFVELFSRIIHFLVLFFR